MDEFEIDREALLSTFLAEAEELLARLERTLMALEAAPGDDELLNSIFRDAHTLKGGAALVAFDAVRELAHDVEHVLERLRRRQLGVTNALVTLLLGSVDVLRAAVGDAAAGRAGSSEATAAFRRRLAEAASAAAAGASATAASPTQVEGAPAGDAAPAARLTRTLRVDVTRLDQMLDLSGEIGIARGRLGEMLERGGSLSAEELLAAHRDADRLYLDLQELIMKSRMVPIGPIFYAHVRTVRDLAAAQGKQARLVVEGADVEVDTSVVEQIRDPILHMVRNALDHGVETPAMRAAAGKPPVATMTLRAFHDSGSMVLQVVDDGAGLDRAAVCRKAARLGLIEDPARATDEEVMQAIFAPGFSTSEVVSEISGRGVGLDVVRRNVEALRGSVSVESGPGGTAFTVRVPLTLAIIQGFRVAVADQTYILPLDSVVECLELPREERGVEPTGVVNLRGRPLPFLRLRAHFGQPAGDGVRENVVVMRHGAATAGLVVDALQGESSTVIKPLGPVFKGVPGVAGSSILGDGRVALILDVGGLLRETLRRAAGRGLLRNAGGVEP
jgi:two-component system, chemotaxis family, sensor kinase CheA